VADINLGVQIGYETQTVSLTSTEWMAVKSGAHLVKDAQGFYDGVVVFNLSK
jgi:trimethylamine:corrinoid methyltransferase-like protein